ncbi:hypothetical protein PENTCL1PPCAC_19514, partial [Pristionchus entomophagus]
DNRFLLRMNGIVLLWFLLFSLSPSMEGASSSISCNGSIPLTHSCGDHAVCVYSVIGETLLSTTVVCSSTSFNHPDCHHTIIGQDETKALLVQCLCSTTSSTCPQQVWQSTKKSASLLALDECLSTSRYVMHSLVIASVSLCSFAVITLCVFQFIDTRGFDRQSKEIESRLAEIKWEIANAQIIEAPMEQPPLEEKTSILTKELDR